MVLVAAPSPILGKRRRHGLADSAIHTVSKRPKPSSNRPVTPESAASDGESDLDSTYDSENSSAASTPPTPQSQPATPAGKPSPRPKKFKCSYEGCTKSFARPVRLEEHIRSHTNERIFKCPYPPCDKDFLRQSHLNHHVKSAHTNERDYVCDWPGCDMKFLTGTRLKRHRQAHEKRDRFRCTAFPPCDKTFRKHMTLQRHIDVDHLHLKPFACKRIDKTTGKNCTAAFDSTGGLRSHEARCHAGKQYWCSICSQVNEEKSDATVPEPTGFATYAELQTHMKLQHPPECEHCGLICSTAGELQRHMDIYHSGVSLEDRRSFICPEPDCGKGFTKQGNLNIHIRSTHEKKKPFVCGETDLSRSSGLQHWDASNACRRGFTAKASLETHVRKFHLDGTSKTPKPSQRRPQTDQTTYRRTLSTAAKLTGAGYVEESGRSLLCPIPSCENRFKRHADLRSHARAVHGLQGAEAAEVLAESEALSGGRFWLGGVGGEEDDQEDENWRELTGFDVPAENISSVRSHGFAMAPPGEVNDTAEVHQLGSPQPAQDDGNLASLITSCLADEMVDPALLATE